MINNGRDIPFQGGLHMYDNTVGIRDLAKNTWRVNMLHDDKCVRLPGKSMQITHTANL